MHTCKGKMTRLLYKITGIFLHLLSVASDVSASYERDREALLKYDALLTPGGNTTLTAAEEVVNNCLMKHKLAELDVAFDNPRYFNFSHHFFTYKAMIRDSKVYRIIKDMPKGAVLHVHLTGILGPDYLLNITYMDNIYMCLENDKIKFRFSEGVPKLVCNETWKLVADARKSSKSAKEFDAALRLFFTLVVDDPDKEYPSINDVWKVFSNYFDTVGSLLNYKPLWEQYIYDALKLIIEHNILYVEIRNFSPNLYELNGVEYEPLEAVRVFREVVKIFVKDYSDFYGAKLIVAPTRNVNQQDLSKCLEWARQIQEEMPEIFAGFDLAGQEDTGTPLIEFVPQLKEVKDMNFFFHAGETDWYGTSTDENLFDAILLGSKRLGHAYALLKHPALVKEVIKRDICLEVNVISNTVLSLVRDVRNHPLSVMLAMGLPVVLSSDDPGVWEADPISDDFYVAFVGAASRLSDLRLLKTLAINSLKYSALSKTEKNIAIAIFKRRWNEFVNKFQCSRY